MEISIAIGPDHSPIRVLVICMPNYRNLSLTSNCQFYLVIHCIGSQMLNVTKLFYPLA